jgi:DHA1 family inner membrane transport protein
LKACTEHQGAGRVCAKVTLQPRLTIFFWGIATFAVVPPLQMRVMNAAQGAPSLAASVNIGAFNLGNALGAAIGGGVIAAGLGYP